MGGISSAMVGTVGYTATPLPVELIPYGIVAIIILLIFIVIVIINRDWFDL
jgi:hypothetical protein